MWYFWTFRDGSCMPAKVCYVVVNVLSPSSVEQIFSCYIYIYICYQLFDIPYGLIFKLCNSLNGLNYSNYSQIKKVFISIPYVFMYSIYRNHNVYVLVIYMYPLFYSCFVGTTTKNSEIMSWPASIIVAF